MIHSTTLTKAEHTSLTEFCSNLPRIITAAGHDELYGHRLSAGPDLDEDIRDELLLKFLKANQFDVALAETQLEASLRWRKDFNPLLAAYSETHDEIFDTIGLVTKYAAGPLPNTSVVAWNLYGAAASPKLLFADVDKFMRWRVGAMEKAVALLDFSSADSHQMVQVHDYKNVNFFRMDADMKRATSQVITTFQQNYPEMMSLKFFLNVPTIVSWVYWFVTRMVATATAQKFHMESSGNLSGWLEGKALPQAYGGTAATTVREQNVMGKAVPSPYAVAIMDEQFHDPVSGMSEAVNN